MGALGPCFSLFQEYTVHTSRLFFLCRVSSYPIQKEEKNTVNPTSLSGGKRPWNWNPQVWKDADRQTCELSLGNNQERFSRYKGLAKHPECSATEGIQASWRRKYPSASLWWQLSALGYNMLHGRSSTALQQLRESESNFNSRTQKADNWTVWNDSWWQRRSKHSSAPNTEACNLERVTADVLQLLGLCTSLSVTSLKL